MTTGITGTAGLTRRLADLYETSRARMVRRWRFRCRTPDEAEDLVQEAYARVYRRYREQGEPPEDDADLLRIIEATARHALIDARRKEATEKRREEFASETSSVDEGGNVLDVPDLDHPVEDEFATRELLLRLVAGLDRHWAAVLEMMCDDFSPAEIGLALGGKNGHVLVRQARVHICRILGDIAAGGDRAAAWIGSRFCGWKAAAA